MTSSLVATTPSAKLIGQWLHGRPATTQDAYRRDIATLLDDFLGGVVALDRLTLADLQGYADALRRLNFAPSTQHRRLSAVKSLLSFGHQLGLLPVNVGAALRLPAVHEHLQARILSEADVHRLIALEPNRRNRTILLLLYAAGLRVAELCALTWGDLHERPTGGVLAVYGKGQKERTVLLPHSVWQELLRLRGRATSAEPVFRSHKGGALCRVQVERIVIAAARRAELGVPVSPHWLRHCHASHALDRGAPLAVVRDTLGHASLSTTSKYIHAKPNESSATYLAV